MHPAIARHVVYPLQERFLNRPTFAYLAELEQSQWWSRAEVEALQMRKLACLLSIAQNHSPWHARRLAEAGLGRLTPETRLESADLARIPTMDRTDAQLNREQIRWAGVPGGLWLYNTGGSSGQPLRFYFGRSRQAADAATRIRSRRWWNVEFGEREVYLWGAPVELSKSDIIKTWRDRLINQLLLNAFAMSPSNMNDYLKAIGRFDPACIYGYASSIALLARHAKEHGLAPLVPSLKVVCTTGEPLYPHQRDIIHEVFGVPVANEFGSRDSGLIAHESSTGQMLVNSETILLEVLDARQIPVAPGETGEAVITGLCSDAQPFIRYRTGDRLSLSSEQCREGRGLHVLDGLVGRSTDFIVTRDGTIMHALAVIYILRAVEGITEFKIVQHRLDLIEVKIVPNARWHDVASQTIEHDLKRRLGETVRVEIHLVDHIDAESSGKHRYVESRVPIPLR